MKKGQKTTSISRPANSYEAWWEPAITSRLLVRDPTSDKHASSRVGVTDEQVQTTVVAAICSLRAERPMVELDSVHERSIATARAFTALLADTDQAVRDFIAVTEGIAASVRKTTVTLYSINLEQALCLLDHQRS